MQLVTLLLLVVALGFLILGLVGSSSALIIASIVASALAVLLIVRVRRGSGQQSRAATERATRVPSSSSADDRAAEAVAAAPVTAAAQPALPDPAPVAHLAGASGAAVPGEPAPADSTIPEITVLPGSADTEAPLRRHGSDSVWVIDGEPRYHLASCRYLVGRPAEEIPLRQAAEDGFSPCLLCDPDRNLGGAGEA